MEERLVHEIITWAEDLLHCSNLFDLYNLETPSTAVAIDATERSIQCLKKPKQEMYQVLGISCNTFYLLENQLEVTGTLEIVPRKRKPSKLPLV